MPVDSLNPDEGNPRKDLKPGDKKYELIRESIQRFGLVEPLVWNATEKKLVSGHQRLKIAKEQGVEAVDVVVVTLTPVDAKSLSIALNKVTGEWDVPKLIDLLDELGGEGMTGTGFDETDLESLRMAPHEFEQEEPETRIQVTILVERERWQWFEEALNNMKQPGIEIHVRPHSKDKKLKCR